VLEFERSMMGQAGDAGAPAVAYWLCAGCGFCFAPEVARWTLEEFEARIYNEDYIRYDPDAVERRPSENAKLLERLFGRDKGSIRHLDYGGGRGLLSRLLRDAGWDSTSYDPFFDRGREPSALGKFDLVTAFEVFEHVPDVNRLVSDLAGLLVDDGLVFFSTLVSDGHIAPGQPLDWWYAAPRNGHISLHTRRSLAILAGKQGFRLGSLSEVAHVFCRTIPPWAARYIGE
jgi:SAM-dependent methyltransferase